MRNHYKPYLLLLFLLEFACNVVFAQKPGAVIDMQHYQFTLKLNDNNNNIEGTATIDFLVLKDAKEVTLDLVNKKANGKGMMVKLVREYGTQLSFTHSNDLLKIEAGVKAGEKRSFIISYEGIPADGLIISENKYKHRGFFADNWPNRARNWIPCIDHPSDKASVDFTVIAPSHYKVISNGLVVEEDPVDETSKLTHYKETVALPTDIMVIGVSDFAVQNAGSVQGIPVYSWVYPEDKEKGFYDYAQALEILPFYIKNIGPYAFKKLANVQSKTIFGGMENASAIFYAENSVTGTRRSESLLAHEIAHQWFGDMATETDWPHLWLSEGFATYMTDLYFENKYGKDTARKMLMADRKQVIAFAKTVQKPVVDSSTTDYMQLLNANSYQKGSWALHMLRMQVGDSAFWLGIRNYYSRYAGKNASTDDLRRVMEETTGQELKQFFQQWLFTAGHPILNVNWKYDINTKEVSLTIVQQQKTTFKFPFELQFYNPADHSSNIISVEIKDKESTIQIPSMFSPSEIVLDPNIKLLFEGTISESKN